MRTSMCVRKYTFWRKKSENIPGNRTTFQFFNHLRNKMITEIAHKDESMKLLT